jgi:transposase-like protein
MEVFTAAGHRRSWSVEDKARIVVESYSGLESVCQVARRYGLAQGQIFAWRRDARMKTLPAPKFVPVVIEPAAAARPKRRRSRLGDGGSRACLTGRMTAADDNTGEMATLRIELLDTDPLIWRQVEGPTGITLKGLHDVIQAAMGGFNQHLWEFRIGRRSMASRCAARPGAAPAHRHRHPRRRSLRRLSSLRRRRAPGAARGLRRCSRLLRCARSARRSRA